VPKLIAMLIVVALGSLLVIGRTAGPGTNQQPPTTAQTTALLVASTNAPLRVLGSDGLEHLEYDLVFTNIFTAPVTLTAIEVISPEGGELLRLAGDALAASTQPVLSGAPSAEVPVAGTVATVIDLALAADQVPARITHRITYDLPADAPALTLIGSRTLNGPALTVDPRLPLVIASPLRGDGWLTANGCCAAESIHRFIGVERLRQDSTSGRAGGRPAIALPSAPSGGMRSHGSPCNPRRPTGAERLPSPSNAPFDGIV
jgi:hypothetical protein